MLSLEEIKERFKKQKAFIESIKNDFKTRNPKTISNLLKSKH